MARKKSKTTQSSESSSETEFGIYNVERIVAKKTDSKGKVFYLIKWEGYPSSQNTWEAEENVFSETLIKDFEEREISKATHLDDEFAPSKSPIKTPVSPRRSPLKNQKAEVVGVKTVTRDPETGELHVHCVMSNGTVEVIPSTIANVQFPQIIINFYESRIKFKDSPSKNLVSHGRQARLIILNEGTTHTLRPCVISYPIAIQGCCHGKLHDIYRTIAKLEQNQNIKVELLLICGDFQATRNEEDLNHMSVPLKYRHMGDFKDYYEGKNIAPIPTIFIGGNHEASNLLQELYYGGWVCPNIYYLGHSGVVNFGGVRIAGISGIYYPRDYDVGYYEKIPFDQNMIRSAYHYREFEIKKLMKINEPIDIFLSHEWPTEIYHHGNMKELLLIKPYFKEEIYANKLGAKPLKELMDVLKPKKWFAAHLHVGFDAVKEFSDGSMTKFTALDKCLPDRDFLRVIDVPTESLGTPILEYDPEWLTILEESEPFMNYNYEKWYLSKDFYRSNPKSKQRMEKNLSEFGKTIECPQSFNGTEVNQTKKFRLMFLSGVLKDKAVELNPDEIELEFC